jgi:KaiC/GvpD/RAD55 family RecA-like ATPase
MKACNTNTTEGSLTSAERINQPPLKFLERERPLVLAQELEEFLSLEGKSLLIKGEAGTGKTTFALELMQRVYNQGSKGVYISTRVSSKRLLEYYPWLESLAGIRNIEGESDQVTSTNEGTLHLLDRRGGQFEEVMERLQGADDQGVQLVVLDSWEALTTNLKEREKESLQELLIERMQEKNTRTVLVSEEYKTTLLDYLVDGVIQLRREYYDGRMFRELEILKLRGTEVRQPKYAFTLREGFRTFPTFRTYNNYDPQRWKVVPDQNNFYSTGIPDLDYILGGGFKAGNYILLEVEKQVSSEALQNFLAPMHCNSLLQGGAVFVYPVSGLNPAQVRSHIEPYVGKEVVDQMVRVAHYGPELEDPIAFRLPGGYVLDDFKIWVDELADLKMRFPKRPLLQTMGYDVAEYIYGAEDMMKIMIPDVTDIRGKGSIRINVAMPFLAAIEKLAYVSDIYLKMTTVHGAPMLYGVNPKTGLYYIDFDFRMGFPFVRLISLV